jgi:hypothetical protein
VINVFQLNFDTRLQNWFELRKELENLDLATKCVEIDKWWQYAPLVNHYLHYDFIDQWPGPWELLVENMYCTIARALGMCYTLLLIGVDNIEMVEATDQNNEDVVLVLVDSAKYILNYWPDTVLNNHLQDFKVKKHININKIKQKI